MDSEKDPPLSIDLLTLFPKMIEGFLEASIIGRAAAKRLVEIRSHDLRDWTNDKHRTVDDRPFGGGAGMLLKPEPFFAAVKELRTPKSCILYMAPDGEPLTPNLARELATLPHWVLISGHYEGIDQRVRDHLVDREIAIGDYVLTNGTLAAAVVIDAAVRYLPGALGKEKSLTQDSFNNSLLSFPQYTRPAHFQGHSVPEVLLSGDHKAIAQWRRQRQIEKTRQRRPNLLSNL